MTTFQLVKASTLKARLGKLSAESANNTLSLAYYTMVNGNVNPLATCDNTISTLLHPVYRQFVCAKWDSKASTWVYSKAKASKLLKELGLEFNNCTFEAFVAAIEENQRTKAAKEADKEAQQEALSPTEIEAQEKEKVLKYMVRTNLSVTQLKDLVALVERERTVKSSKQANLKTAA